MILLPRGNPVKEQIDPGKVNLPDALGKLRDGGFTGYLRFDAGGGTGILIFERGRLISALFEGAGERLIAYDAIGRIFDLSLAGGARLDIYRLSADLALSIHALLHGEVRYRGQEIKLIDIKALLAQLREERVNGCLRIYTAERIALIFYRNGAPLGFFHDGSTEIETTANTSMSVAQLPGAKIDVLATRPFDEQDLADLLESADIAGLWQKSREQLVRQKRSQAEAASRSQELREQENRQKALALLRATAERHLGRIGLSLTEKEFDKVAPGPLSEAALAGFYDNLARAAKLVAGPTKVGAMLDEMKRGVKSLLRPA
jgi:hypothetical protein